MTKPKPFTRAWWRKQGLEFGLTILGALFVVGSFALKDDYRERVNSLADTIDRQQSEFILTAETERVYNLIKKDQRQINVLEPSKIASSGGWVLMDKDGKWITTANDEVQNAQVMLNSVFRLASRITENKTLNEERQKIEAKISEFNSEWKAFSGMTPAPLSFPPKGGVPIFHLEKGNFSYLSEALSVDSKASAIVSETQKLGVETLRLANEAREEKERLAKCITIGCYVVTFLGSALTLAGVFLGIEVHFG